MLFNYDYDYWALKAKITFDGDKRVITVNTDTSTLNIRELYASWKEWTRLRDNAKFLPALRTVGGDPIGSGAFTGDSYFLVNGWKLSVDLAKVRVTGVLFSDDYDTAYYTLNLTAQYPATVAALVNTISVPSTITPAELWAYNNRSLSVEPPTAQQIADSTWSHTFVSKLLTVAKFLGLK